MLSMHDGEVVPAGAEFLVAGTSMCIMPDLLAVRGLACIKEDGTGAVDDVTQDTGDSMVPVNSNFLQAAEAEVISIY